MASVVRFDEWQDTNGNPVLRFAEGQVEVWDGSGWTNAVYDSTPISAEYLVISGGGGGGRHYAGGGGAGGYLSGTTAIPANSFFVSVGAGGAGGVSANGERGSLGNPSILHAISPVPGGGGIGRDATGNVYTKAGGSGGGGGGGAGNLRLGGHEIIDQGNFGGNGYDSGGSSAGGGGGGAGGGGSSGGSSAGGAGGIGSSSSITGTSITRAIGGQGASNAINGLGGGASSGKNGEANTGGGGGGGASNIDGGSGGSGVVIIKISESYNAVIPAGLSANTTVSGGYKIIEFVSGIGNVRIY